MMTIEQFETVLKQGPYAWPGGYPYYFIMADNTIISHGAAVELKDEIILCMSGEEDDKSRIPICCQVNWGSEMYCEETGELIESAYPNEEDEDNEND